MLRNNTSYLVFSRHISCGNSGHILELVGYELSDKHTLTFKTLFYKSEKKFSTEIAESWRFVAVNIQRVRVDEDPGNFVEDPASVNFLGSTERSVSDWPFRTAANFW